MIRGKQRIRGCEGQAAPDRSDANTPQDHAVQWQGQRKHRLACVQHKPVRLRRQEMTFYALVPSRIPLKRIVLTRGSCLQLKVY